MLSVYRVGVELLVLVYVALQSCPKCIRGMLYILHINAVPSFETVKPHAIYVCCEVVAFAMTVLQKMTQTMCVALLCLCH